MFHMIPRSFLSSARAAPLLTFRSFHQSALSHASGKAQFYHALKEDRQDTWNSDTIPAKELLNNLRIFQSERTITNNSDTANNYRDALRTLSNLVYSHPTPLKEIRLTEIEEALSTENNISWSLIADMMENPGEEPSKMAGWSEEKKAEVLLNRVHGVGPAKAKDFVSKGVMTIEQLMREKKLPKSILVGGRHLEDMETMIPKSEIDVFKGLLTDVFKAADPEIKFEIMGSYRRGEAVSSDIDLVAWHPDYQEFDKKGTWDSKVILLGLMRKLSDALNAANLLFPDKLLSNGNKKLMGLTRLPNGHRYLRGREATWRQIDIRLCPLTSVHYMLLGNTGDDQLMKLMRGIAKTKGWGLNEYGMGQRDPDQHSGHYLKGTEKIVQSEQEIFELLGLPYLEPTDRSFRHYSKLPGYGKSIWQRF